MNYAHIVGFNKIRIFSDTSLDIEKIKFFNNNVLLSISYFTTNENTIDIFLKENISIKDFCHISYNDTTIKAIYKDLFKTSEFENKYHYSGELGAIYSPSSTTFKVWSPAASKIDLLLYSQGDADTNENPTVIKLTEENGLWSTTIKDDLKGIFYTYEVTVYDETNEIVDPYAKAVGINGLRGAVVDLASTNPENWSKDFSPELKSFTDAIIYEISIRDLSSCVNSGIVNKGKFLGLTEENTSYNGNISTGLSHIKDLGVTHVQILPMYDFSNISVDEKNPTEKYNWGYDPQNYNAPEGSFATNAYDPLCRIKELKQMVACLHKNNLSVNMDVVYNHMYEVVYTNLHKLFPGYFFREDDFGNFSDGTGCGNDTCSEHSMFRKFMVDSTMYWVKEYHLDGLRFDLMGIHDVDTMNEIRNSLNTLGRPIMLYGEGWTLNTMLPAQLRATQYNAYKMPHIGHFNDVVRNSIRGSVFEVHEKGFASGEGYLEHDIKKCVTACIHFDDNVIGAYETPDQTINYISAHDNHTIWDKLALSNAEDSIEDRKYMQKFANAIVLTCQGIAFLHAGVEFCRTKQGVENSYKSPDAINSIDWSRKAEFLDVFEYYKGIIFLKKGTSSL